MDKDTREGIKCQYCESPTELSEMRFGFVMQCSNPSCAAYVSITSVNTAKGCTANNELRKMRRDTHKYIDKLIHMKSNDGNVSKALAKQKLYEYVHQKLEYDFKFNSLAQLNEKETIELQNFLKQVIENAIRKKEQRSQVRKHSA